MRGMYMQQQMQQVQQVTPKHPPLERGATVEDADGSHWRIAGHEVTDGTASYSRVRVGSLADSIIFGGPQ